MNNNFFNFFKPKEDKFFPMLSYISERIVLVAQLAEECIHQAETRKDIIEYMKKIRVLKKESSKRQNDIFYELNVTFITPFDREDVNSLASYMKDTIDNISACAKRIMLYEPKSIPERGEIMAKLVKSSSEYIDKAVKELGNLKKDHRKVSEYCEEISKNENQVDEVYEQFLIDLFKNEKDAIELVKLKDILERLENASDSAEKVSKVIKTIIVKYA